MNLQQIIENLGIFTIGTVTITTVIGFIAKSIFNNYLNKRTELYKSELLQENEKFKAELQKQNTEHQIKFSTLHTDRASIIKDLHNGFIALQKELIQFNNDKELQNLPSEANPVLMKFDEIKTIFSKNRFYFSTTLCDKIDEYLMRFVTSAAISEFFSKNRNKYRISRKNDPTDKELEQKDFIDMLNDSEILKELENDFRNLIGVDK